jgi:hypothetical protein
MILQNAGVLTETAISMGVDFEGMVSLAELAAESLRRQLNHKKGGGETVDSSSMKQNESESNAT